MVNDQRSNGVKRNNEITDLTNPNNIVLLAQPAQVLRQSTDLRVVVESDSHPMTEFGFP